MVGGWVWDCRCAVEEDGQNYYAATVSPGPPVYGPLDGDRTVEDTYTLFLLMMKD